MPAGRSYNDEPTTQSTVIGDAKKRMLSHSGVDVSRETCESPWWGEGYPPFERGYARQRPWTRYEWAGKGRSKRIKQQPERVQSIRETSPNLPLSERFVTAARVAALAGDFGDGSVAVQRYKCHRGVRGETEEARVPREAVVLETDRLQGRQGGQAPRDGAGEGASVDPKLRHEGQVAEGVRERPGEARVLPQVDEVHADHLSNFRSQDAGEIVLAES
mmetsp:Transcript_24802/g.72666  ORF Transcript_24802/g.72666 Transcript_24802/m.72666 type:complete len:218 (-) Transcript_24802:1124-1777(-)